MARSIVAKFNPDRASPTPWQKVVNSPDSIPASASEPAFTPCQGTLPMMPTDGIAAPRITGGSAVWVYEGLSWWRALVVHEKGGYCIVRLDHGVTLPVNVAELRPRDPECNGADRPQTKR